MPIDPIALPDAVGPFAIPAELTPSVNCDGRPVMFGTDVYVLLSDYHGGSLIAPSTLEVYKGESKGEGPWTLVHSIDLGVTGGFERPADSVEYEGKWYVLYLHSDGLYHDPDPPNNLHWSNPTLTIVQFDPVEHTWTEYASVIAPDGLTAEGALRLVARSNGDLVVFYTRRPSQNELPATCMAQVVTVGGFGTAFEVTPDNRDEVYQSWGSLDAFVGTDDTIHVLSYSVTTGAEWPSPLLYTRLDPDNTLTTTRFGPPAPYVYGGPTKSAALGTRGVLIGGKPVFPYAILTDPDAYVIPALAVIGESASVVLYSFLGETADICASDTNSCVIMSGRAFHIYSGVRAPYSVNAIQTDGTSFAEEEAPLFGESYDLSRPNAGLTVGSMAGGASLGFVSIYVDDTTDFTQAVVFHRIDRPSDPVAAARYYAF